MTKTNYEKAQAILNDGALANRMLYKEHLLEKASALSTLALADAIRGEQTTTAGDWMYTLMVKPPGEPFALVSIWSDEAVANGKADAANKEAPEGYRYIVAPYKLDTDYRHP
ncbi:hypothetical protein SEA_ATUIN_275 [Arthrobacter phage Atuin]|nr:hypothetical protein SEA_ATUIN_74 [Arthrobacter phage Atuin]